MADVEFLTPKMVGRRFNGGQIPLSCLQDFSALERLIVDVAKQKFRDANVNRKRVSPRFFEGVSLKLIGVEDGSAIPKIILTSVAGLLFSTQAQFFYEQSRDAVIEAISQADRGDRISALEPKYLEYFQRFGRSLIDGESIEFDRSEGRPPATLNNESRRRLVLASTSSAEFSDSHFVRGKIIATNTQDRSFVIEAIEGAKISGPLAAPHTDTIFDLEKRQLTDKPSSIVYGIAKFDQSGRPKAFESIEDVIELDPLDFTVRLAELSKLKAGWLDGEGEAPSALGLGWLKDKLQRNYPDALDLPYLYPTPDGGVRAEWTFGRNDVSLDIEFGNFTAYWHELNLDTKVDDEDVFALVNDSEWIRLIEKLRTFSGASA